MSYDIVYEQLALRVPKEDVVQQACTFFKERLNHTNTKAPTNSSKSCMNVTDLDCVKMTYLCSTCSLALAISLTRRQTNEHVAGSSVV